MTLVMQKRLMPKINEWGTVVAGSKAILTSTSSSAITDIHPSHEWPARPNDITDYLDGRSSSVIDRALFLLVPPKNDEALLLPYFQNDLARYFVTPTDTI